VQALVAAQDYKAAMQSFAEMELYAEEGSLMGHSTGISANTFAQYMFCCLLAGEVGAAKYLWKRAPHEAGAQEGQEGQTQGWLSEVWAVGAKLQRDDLPGALALLDRGGLEPWPRSLVPLASALRASLCDAYFAAVGQAYSVVGAQQVASFTLLSLDEVLQKAASLGWGVDAQGLLTPSPAPLSAMLVADAALNENMALMQRLTGFAAHFEKTTLAVEVGGKSKGTSTPASSSSAAPSAVY